MYQTYYWFNKPSETVILCKNCANKKTNNPDKKYNWEDTYPETTLLCKNCNTEI